MKKLIVSLILLLAIFLTGCQTLERTGPRVYGPPPAPGAYSGSTHDMGPTKFRFLGITGTVSGDTVSFMNMLPETVAIDTGYYDELSYLTPGGSFDLDLAKVRNAGLSGYAIIKLYRVDASGRVVPITVERFALSGAGRYTYNHVCTIGSRNGRIYVSRR